MSLSKQVTIDKIEVMENGIVQVREITRILENEKVISTSYNRWSVAPGEDFSQQPENVKAICQVAHTQKNIDAYQTALQSNPLLGK